MITLQPESLYPFEQPYLFNGEYEDCYASSPCTSMDLRHVYLLNDILKCWEFKSALEIGSFNGSSSTAFIEAINSGEGLGKSGRAIFCDVSVRPSLLRVVKNCKDPSRARITPQPSWEVLKTSMDFDFIFVDGCHDIQSVSVEFAHLKRRRPLCIMGHDTNATQAGHLHCEGAEMLRKELQKDAGYFCLSDSKQRPDEMTERGLFFATTSILLFEKAEKIFNKWA